ncbi:hypothetical protein CAOG_07479 [Capsaspora owczarzaki ATCC 30864]|uniref:Autophagy protein ATG17-like domain-containing protein n=1 Tax=Capsaspora owczarzaki (strain ATCC 30864) TaxID=595528 RepID=A0A0D2X509_CAPO3|nr:hypothetical protein CAOG_07479 [Capsaspora owczarzaki ATCC 30864]KJE96989.1 hypothetical protein CAOG_007479 [Capsaspora owczarzaki ATCC 30864]|eukprot:XP_004343353.2 hypothetical protein CAOG_07479 [Capsaspora owczarzaki ATCC 30864]
MSGGSRLDELDQRATQHLSHSERHLETARRELLQCVQSAEQLKANASKLMQVITGADQQMGTLRTVVEQLHDKRASLGNEYNALAERRDRVYDELADILTVLQSKALDEKLQVQVPLEQAIAESMNLGISQQDVRLPLSPSSANPQTLKDFVDMESVASLQRELEARLDGLLLVVNQWRSVYEQVEAALTTLLRQHAASTLRATEAHKAVTGPMGSGPSSLSASFSTASSVVASTVNIASASTARSPTAEQSSSAVPAASDASVTPAAAVVAATTLQLGSDSSRSDAHLDASIALANATSASSSPGTKAQPSQVEHAVQRAQQILAEIATLVLKVRNICRNVSDEQTLASARYIPGVVDTSDADTVSKLAAQVDQVPEMLSAIETALVTLKASSTTIENLGVRVRNANQALTSLLTEIDSFGGSYLGETLNSLEMLAEGFRQQTMHCQEMIDEIAQLVDWYRRFAAGYDALLIELPRRRAELARQVQVVQRINLALEQMVMREEDTRAAFMETFGQYLPPTLAHTVAEPPPAFHIEPAQVTSNIPPLRTPPVTVVDALQRRRPDSPDAAEAEIANLVSSLNPP